KRRRHGPTPWRRAIASTTRNPTLWRVLAEDAPGVAPPTNRTRTTRPSKPPAPPPPNRAPAGARQTDERREARTHTLPGAWGRRDERMESRAHPGAVVWEIDRADRDAL